MNYISEFFTDDLDDLTDIQSLKNWDFKTNSGFQGKQLFSKCGKQKGNKLVGGYLVFSGRKDIQFGIYPTSAKRKIKKPIIPYWSFQVSVKIFKIDSWNDEKLEVYINKDDYYYYYYDYLKTFKFSSCFDQLDICGSKTKPEGIDFNYAFNDGIQLFSYNSSDTNQIKELVNIQLKSYHDAEENESWGFREFKVDIDSCHPSCKQCTGPASNQCESCFSDSNLINEYCVCKANKKMQLNLITNCYKDQLSFDSCSLCQSTCLDGQFESKDPTNKGFICLQCDKNCKTCLSSSQNCSSCFNSYYLDKNLDGSAICKKCHESCSTCSSFRDCIQCQEGYFSLVPTSESTCIKCDDSCLKCQIRADNCLQCSQGYYLIQYKGQIFCKKCPQNCEDCTYDSIKMVPVCIKCLKGKFMQSGTQKCLDISTECGLGMYGLEQDRICTQQCPQIGYYKDDQQMMCKECHPFCETCFHKYQTHCQKCKEGYLLDSMTCTKQCINSQEKIPDTLNGDCNYYFDKFVTLTQGYCKIACQQGTVYSEEAYTCISCGNNCHNCQLNYGVIKCIECQYPYFLTSQGECLKDCPKGYYKDPINISCSLNCPEGYFKSLNQQCQACFLGCKTCTDSSTCTQCFDVWQPENNGQTIIKCQCENGFSQNVNNDKCVECKLNCQKCDPITLNCIECNPSSNFQIDLATQQCSVCKLGYKLDQSSSTCQPCLPNDYTNLTLVTCKCQDSCETCDNAQQCLTCKNKDPNLDLSNCKCKSSYFLDNQTQLCQKCGDGCSQCKSSNICIKCQPSFYLDPNYKCASSCSGSYYPDDNNQICSDQCPSGKFGVSQGAQNICQDCDSSCQKCTLSSKNCTVCSDNLNRFVYEGKITCTETCPPNTYQSQNPIKECILCTQNVSYCTSCTSSSCLSCQEGYYLSSNLCKPCIPYCSQCVNSISCSVCQNGYEIYNNNCYEICKDGYFRDPSNPTCKQCQKNCKTCDASSDNCTECAPNFSKNSSNICIQDSCQEGEFLKIGDVFCSKCHVSCKKCADADRKCSECSDNFKPIDNTDLSKGCELSDCNKDGYYSDGAHCNECLLNCKKCINGTECVLCNDYYDISIDKKSCIKTPCNQTQCQFCLSSNSCNVCQQGYTLNSGICECPAGQYNTAGGCQNCNQECNSCTSSPQNCINCKTGYEKYSGSQQCYPVCETGQYRINQNEPCQDCKLSCKTCQNTKENCTSCYDGYKLQNGICIEICRIGQFKDVNNQCSICSENCLQCENKKDFCTECHLNYQLNQQFLPDIQFCKEICSPGFFFPKIIPGDPLEPSKLKCTKCDSNCKTCSDTSDNCTECADSFQFQNFQGNQKCKQNCQTQGTEIGTDSSLYCEKCDSNCLECQINVTQCTSCKHNFVLVGNKCIETCSEGQFLPKDKMECEKCDISCKTCANSALECNDCNIGYNKNDQNKCIKVCSENQYTSKSNFCIDCEVQLCKSCQDAPYKCTSCKEGYTFIQKDSTCFLDKCQDGQYLVTFDYQWRNQDSNIPGPNPNPKVYQCINCSTNCKTCETSDSKCTSCQDTHDLIDNQCYEKCKVGQLRDVSTKNCISCHTNCKSCIEDPKKCTLCNDGQEIIEYSCYSPCKDGTYRNADKQCLQCDPICKKCIETPTKCTECDTNTYDFFDNKCLLKCKAIGEFRNQEKQCTSCKDNCKKCIETANKCIECHENFKLAENNPRFQKTECIPICKENEFINENKLCEKCDESCFTCDILSNKCLSCREGQEYDEIQFKCNEIIQSYQDFSLSGFFFVSMITLLLIIILILVNPKNLYGLYTLQLVQIIGNFIAQFKTLKPTLANDYFNPMYKFNISPLIPFNLANSIEEVEQYRFFTNSYFQNNAIFHAFLIGMILMACFFYKNWSRQFGKLYFKIISATSNLFLFSVCYQIKYGTFDNSNGFIIWSYVCMGLFIVGYLFSFFYTYHWQLYLLYSEIEDKYFYHYLEARKIISNLLIVFAPFKFSFSVLIANSLVSIFFIRSNPIILPGSFQNLVRVTEIIYLMAHVAIVTHSNILSSNSEIALIVFLLFFKIFLIIVIAVQLIRSYLIKRSKGNQIDVEQLIKFKLNINSKDVSFSDLSQSMEAPQITSKTVQWVQNPLQSQIFRQTNATIFTTRQKEGSNLTNQNFQDCSPLKKCLTGANPIIKNDNDQL